jgi:hypothetical protein
MKYRVSLSIGFVGAKHEDIIDVDDDELAACDTDNARDDLLEQYWQDWANNYIDGGIWPDGGDE